MVCEWMMKCFSIGIMCIGWKFWKALSFKIWRKISINKYVINIYMNRECPQTPEICTKTLYFKGRICLNSWTHRLHTESVISFLIDGFTFIHSHQLDHHRMGNLGPHLGGLSSFYPYVRFERASLCLYLCRTATAAAVWKSQHGNHFSCR